MAIVSGDAQAATVGTPLGAPLTVRITSAQGRGVEGVPVDWVPSAGGGTVTPANARTDAAGRVQAAWTLGIAGGTNEVIATSPRLAGTSVRFTATGTPDVPSAIVPLSGGDQVGVVGEVLSAPVVLRVADRYDNPVANASVTFTAGGGGSFAPASVLTGADGRAQAQWTLGGAPGPQVATVAVAGVSGVAATVSASAAAGPLAEIRLEPATIRLTALLDSAQITATGYDRLGNPLPNTVFYWWSDAYAVFVRETGWVRAVVPGTSTVTARSGHIQGAAVVTVTQLATHILLDPLNPMLLPGESLQLMVSATDANGQALRLPEFDWESSNGAVASVDWHGLVKALGIGVTQVTVRQRGNPGASVTTPVTVATDFVLQDGVPVSGIRDIFTSQRHYRIGVPASSSRLTVVTSGSAGFGDVDLYVRRGAPPTLDEYDCVSETPVNSESCIFEDPLGGEWYIMLYGYNSYAGVTLCATYSASPGACGLSDGVTGQSRSAPAPKAFGPSAATRPSTQGGDARGIEPPSKG